jgi:hypothetical protein
MQSLLSKKGFRACKGIDGTKRKAVRSTRIGFATLDESGKIPSLIFFQRQAGLALPFDRLMNQLFVAKLSTHNGITIFPGKI